MIRIGERIRAGKAVFVLAAAALLLGACVAPVADDYWYDDDYSSYGYDYPYGDQQHYGYLQSYGHQHGDGPHLGSRRDHRQRPGHRAGHGPRRGHPDARPDHGKPNHDHAGPNPDHAGPNPDHAARQKLRHGDGLGERPRDGARPAGVKRRAPPVSAKREAIREALGDVARRQPRARRPADAAVGSRARPDHVPRGTTEGAKKDAEKQAKKQAKKHQRAPTALLLRPARPAPDHARGAGRSARRDHEQ